jgi:hypothetical protein
MKLTKTFYHQFGLNDNNLTPIQIPNAVPPAIFPPPSGEYASALTVDPVAQIDIYIPFKVKKIHVKGISYVCGMNSSQITLDADPQVKQYVTITSNLVANAPVGMVYLDSAFSSATIQDIEHTFLVPENIQGTYDFTLYTNDGIQYTPYTQEIDIGIPAWYYFFDSFAITMEFLSEDEI